MYYLIDISTTYTIFQKLQDDPTHLGVMLISYRIYYIIIKRLRKESGHFLHTINGLHVIIGLKNCAKFCDV